VSYFAICRVSATIPVRVCGLYDRVAQLVLPLRTTPPALPAFSRDDRTAPGAEQSEFTAGDSAEHDEPGSSLALSGNSALIGAHFDFDEDGSDTGADTGSIFTHSGSACILQIPRSQTTTEAGPGA